jgi:RHS repeat-associated protein
VCACRIGDLDPLVLTLDGSPIHLTDVAGGVAFDVNGDGALEPVSWTAAGSGAAWLALDLDGDGAITTGAELFGVEVAASRQGKPSRGTSAFTLLAAYDDPANGGNGDGIISAADAVFNKLRLWVDGNHDGVSQPDELVALDTAGVVSIELSYQITGRRDGVGNVYRYRGTVHLASGRSVPIWDVFLATTQAADTQVAGLSSRGFTAAVGHRLVQVGAWMRRALTPRSVSAVAGTRSVPRLTAQLRSLTWWPGESISSAALVPAASGDNGLNGDNPPPAEPQSPPPQPTQVVEYYHFDLLGSVRAVTDEQGNVIARHDFMPFGEEIAPQFPPTERKLFTGQERDFETGLDYFNARQYRPDLGQFTAPDPMSLVPEPVGSQALGSYTYVSNSPLDSVDPSGLWGFNIGFGGFTWGAGGASFWAYAGGGFGFGSSGWSGAGLSIGSLGGMSFSFSVRGSSSALDLNAILTGAANSYATNFTLGIGRQSGDASFRLGQAIGDVASAVVGVVEVSGGVGGEVGGIALDSTGAGAVVGVPLNVVSAGLISHGTVMTSAALGHLISAPFERGSEHTSGARPSTKQKHEDGQARKTRDRGGENGDERRRPPRKRPLNWKGPWPVK